MTDRGPLQARIEHFASFLRAGEDEACSMALRRGATIGRPVGDAAFLMGLEELTGRRLRAGKRGPKPKVTK